MIGIGIGVNKQRVAGSSLAATLALAHKTRVEADGGVVPDLSRLTSAYASLIAAYAVTDYVGFAAALAVVYDAHVWGYKIGAGSGVTAGQACSKLYSYQTDASGDAAQATAGSQPLLLAHSGDNYYWVPQITGNNCTSNTEVTYNPLADTLTITAKIFSNNQSAGGYDSVVAQGTLFKLQFRNGGATKQIRISATTDAAASTAYTPSSTAPHFVRATVSLANITYEWSADSSNWTTLDTGVTLPTFGTTGTLTIGDSSNTTNAMSIYSVVCAASSTITFAPASYSASTSQTAWTGGGATWTINTGTASTGFKSWLVDRTKLLSSGVNNMNLKVMGQGIFQGSGNFSLYGASRKVGEFAPGTLAGNYDSGNLQMLNTKDNYGLYLNQSDYVAESNAHLQKLIGYRRTGTTYYIYKNNTQTKTGTNSQSMGASNSNFALFTNTSGTEPLNGSIDTVIHSRVYLDDTKNTEIYNLIRSLNNNAF